jgi:hypothetical protein
MTKPDEEFEALLAHVADAVGEGEFQTILRTAKWSARALELTLDCWIHQADPETWTLRCENALAHSITSHCAGNLQLVRDHPSLWPFSRYASAYFVGTPPDSEAAVGALYEAHREAVGSWIPFGNYLNDTPGPSGEKILQPSELLAGGYGLLAKGPAKLLEVYKDALSRLGVEVSISGFYAPWINYTPSEATYPTDDPWALLLDSSYVIGIGWSARKELDGGAVGR